MLWLKYLLPDFQKFSGFGYIVFLKEKNRMITVCGVYCEKECRAFGNECSGCHQLQGKVSWTKFIGKTVCPIYECVESKGYSNCLDCNELPCSTWLVETKNPDMSDEDYAKHLQDRINNLKNKSKER
jgi:Protein of unknown function (DUF3795)